MSENYSKLHQVSRDGKILKDDDIKILKNNNILLDKKFIQIVEERYYRHVYWDDPDYYSIPMDLRSCEGIVRGNEEFSFCSICNTEIDVRGKLEFKSSLISIDDKRVLKRAVAILKDLNFTQIGTSFDWVYSEFDLVLSIDGVNKFRKNHKVINAGMNRAIGIISMDPSIILDKSFLKSIWWFILVDAKDIILWINSLQSFIDKNKPTVEEVENYYNSKIEPLNDSNFEDFCRDLLNEIPKNKIFFLDKMNMLKHLSVDILGNFAVRIGAAGNPDIRYFSKHDYYYVIFQPLSIGDPKFYGKNSRVGIEQWRQLVDQSMGNSGFIMSANNNVANTVWEKIYRYKIHNNNQFQYVVITLEMLKEIICTFCPWLIDSKYVVE